MRPSFLVVLPLATALSLLHAGCGGSAPAGAPQPSPEAGDGKYHPATDGTPMQEKAACDALTAAFSAQTQMLGCVSTAPLCPDLLREEFMTQCLQYDQGSVTGCGAYYAQAGTCMALAMARDNCVVSPVASSAPNGC